MIKIHHLNFSRSTRILWLMEELEAPYEIVAYKRNEQTFRAPPELEKVHPLGKAPIIEDGDLVLAESGAIIEYVLETQGNGKLAPQRGTAEWGRYLGWLHYAEGSAMLPLLTHLLGNLTGGLSEGLKGFMDPEIDKTLAYISSSLSDDGWIVGRMFTAADIQMSYAVEVARMGKLLAGHPKLQGYLERIEARPAFQRALARGGPVALPLG